MDNLNLPSEISSVAGSLTLTRLLYEELLLDLLESEGLLSREPCLFVFRPRHDSLGLLVGDECNEFPRDSLEWRDLPSGECWGLYEGDGGREWF